MVDHKIRWTNSRGQDVVATITIQTTEIAYADGDNITVPCCEWRETVELAGRIVANHIDRLSPPREATGGVMVAGQADRIGIPIVQMAAIDVARAELRTTPAWVAHEARIARNCTEAAEDDRSQRALPGWCPRCQSCCYGDCTAHE